MLKRDINPSLEELRLYSMPPTPNAEEPSRNIFSAQLRSRTSLESGEVRTRLDRMLSDPNESLLFGSFRRSSSRQRIGLFGREACFEGGDISNVDEFIAFDRAKRRNGRDDELISLSDGEVLEEGEDGSFFGRINKRSRFPTLTKQFPEEEEKKIILTEKEPTNTPLEEPQPEPNSPLLEEGQKHSTMEVAQRENDDLNKEWE